MKISVLLLGTIGVLGLLKVECKESKNRFRHGEQYEVSEVDIQDKLETEPLLFEEYLRRDDEELVLGAKTSPLDIRVTRPLGPKGYNTLRISVISVGPRTFDDFDFQYAQPFKFRWTHAFDMGRAGVECNQESVLDSIFVSNEPECLFHCSDREECAAYTMYRASVASLSSLSANKLLCKLAYSTCKLQKNPLATVTYEKLGRRYLYSSLVEAKSGVNEWRIGGMTVKVKLPAENEGVRGIIWGDPGFSSRFIGAKYSRFFHSFNRSVEMLNTISQDPDLHFFQIIGDNFYDLDGRITQKIFDAFSIEAKSKIFQTVVGNHDLWIHTNYLPENQHGNGFMQFYAQDTVASKNLTQLFNFSFDPNKAPKDSTPFHQSEENFAWYHKIGNVGFIGFANSASHEQMEPIFQQACAYFAFSKPAFIFVEGHWNKPGMGAKTNMETPLVRDYLAGVEGCNIGDRLKAIQGHTHCNMVTGYGEREAVEFMIGAHGMDDKQCDAETGFLYLETTNSGELELYYFEEGNAKDPNSNYGNIISCLGATRSISECKQFGKRWLHSISN